MNQVYTEAQQTLSENWVKEQVGPVSKIVPLTGDAGHRRYYRLYGQKKTFIGVIDHDPRSFSAFHSVTNHLKQHQFSVPTIHAMHPQNCWMILSDLGDQTLLDQCRQSDHQVYYLQAIDIIVQLMHCSVPSELKPFAKEDLRRELDLFTEWFCPRILQTPLSAIEQERFREESEALIHGIIGMPQVFMHRDFHSANLMIHKDTVHMIDYQDARKGPYLYDFVSLTRDCYIDWPQSQCRSWCEYLIERTPLVDSMETMMRDYRSIALQRLLKCLGLFVRLKFRDNKVHYVQNYPRMFDYLSAIFSHQEYPGIAEIFQQRGLIE